MKNSILVFKFGGASIKSSAAILNVIEILKLYPNQQILIVVSAMGKTTNHLESIFTSFLQKDETNFIAKTEALKTFHVEIVNSVFSKKNRETIGTAVGHIFDEIASFYNTDRQKNKGALYDSFVSFGEQLSSLILQNKIRQELNESILSDARTLIQTDSCFQKANVDWETSIQKIQTSSIPKLKSERIIVTQGFISADRNGYTTTLGREGSDYSAGIFAHALNAVSVTIWKDVPGMLNADPKFFKNTVKLDRISFREAIELSYYGASVIHPKTLKPLQNKKIPLFVKSFEKPEEPGTKIDIDTSNDHVIPSFIFKKKQVLFSVTPKDFSFLIEENLSDIFSKLSQANAEINIMQNSALSFSFLVNENKEKIQSILHVLSGSYQIKYNTNLELVTVRHYDQKTNDFVCKGKTILLQQKTRTTARFVLA